MADQSLSDQIFFCGIGGSGMMPLAQILAARGLHVEGSDRAADAGRLAAKFDALRALGIAVHPQDGSGLAPGMTLVSSAAVEDHVPDVVRARELGLVHLKRPALLARILNAARTSIAVGGTSGKSTVTAMVGHMLAALGRDPTIINGAAMKNLVPPTAARVGDPDLIVAEVDESDGSIAFYAPTVALLANVSLDHHSLDELRRLFGGFLAAADKAVVNIDDAESALLAQSLPADRCLRVGFGNGDLTGQDLRVEPDKSHFVVAVGGDRHPVTVNLPGRHNAANALLALGAIAALDLPLPAAIAALADFAGIKRRLERVGEGRGVRVIDDFAHNPDKIAASLATLSLTPGRLLLMFQPHGFGPIAKMGDELAATFATGLRPDDRLWLTDPVYQGGTVERSRGSDWLAQKIGAQATHLPSRSTIGDAMLAEARPGDTIVVMGARDDSLSEFAAELVARLNG